MNKILYLPIKKKWFDMIISGEKKEEYRDISIYWIRRLYEKGIYINNDDRKNFDFIIFRNGYAPDSPFLKVKYNGFKIGLGKKEWGASDNFQFIFKI